MDAEIRSGFLKKETVVKLYLPYSRTTVFIHHSQF